MSKTRRQIKKKPELLFRLAEQDTEGRISRETLVRLAAWRGTTETEVMHYALKRLADNVLPLYEADDGPLTNAQIGVIRERAILPECSETCSSLFED